MKHLKIFGIATLVCGSVLAAPAMAQGDSAAQPPQTVNGLKLAPDGGSGPDKTRFKIVSKQEQEQQLQARRQQMQPSTPTPQQSATAAGGGLALQPDGGSGPDKTRFKIISKKEAERRQTQYQQSGGNGMTNDGTGGGENSSGN